MKIVVIGGSGFIGTHLVQRLLELGQSVTIFDLAPSTRFADLVTIGDVRDRAALAQATRGADSLINLAAEHRDDVQPRSRYFDVNVDGATSVVEAATQNRIARIVFISSVAVYGLNQPDADEFARIAPFNAYGESKAQAEAVYASWAAAAADRALLLLRPAVVFGEGNVGNVYHLIDQLRRGRLVMIGSGRNRKSIGYVGNLVDFIASQIEIGPGTHRFNSADKPDLTTTELVAAICRLLPDTRPPRLTLPYALALFIGYAGDALAWLRGRPLLISSVRVRKFCADTRIATKALERSGFRPRYEIAEGLRRMLAAMEEREKPEQLE